MNDKERLEDIKDKYSDFLNQSESSTIAISQINLATLIEQAERVRELEELVRQEIDKNTDIIAKNHLLRQQNKCYREALEFYAREEIYEFETIVSDCDIEVESKALDDYGEKARKALEGEENE